MCGRRDVDPSARLEKRELTQKRSFKAKIKELKNKTNKQTKDLAGLEQGIIIQGIIREPMN